MIEWLLVLVFLLLYVNEYRLRLRDRADLREHQVMLHALLGRQAQMEQAMRPLPEVKDSPAHSWRRWQ